MANVLIDVFDGAMVVCAIYTLNVLHPGWLLERVIREPSMMLRATMSPSGSPRTSLLNVTFTKQAGPSFSNEETD